MESTKRRLICMLLITEKEWKPYETKVNIGLVKVTRLEIFTIQKEVVQFLLTQDFIKRKLHSVTVLYCVRETIISGVK